MNAKKGALGRGLSVLLQNADDVNALNTATTGSIIFIALDLIETNPYQPRNVFEEEALNELADSIEKIGVIQPITVCKTENDKFRLIAGERRYRASKLAGLTEIPAFIRASGSDIEMLQMALIENIQREDLNPIDISLSFKRLVEEFSLTQEELSNKIGKKRSTVTNYLRLLKLPVDIQASIRDGLLSMGHARALISISDEKKQLKLYNRIIQKGLSVREVEKIAKELIQKKDKSETDINLRKHLKAVKNELTAKLGMKVDLKRDLKGFVNILIKCNTDEELGHLIEILKK